MRGQQGRVAGWHVRHAYRLLCLLCRAGRVRTWCLGTVAKKGGGGNKESIHEPAPRRSGASCFALEGGRDVSVGDLTWGGEGRVGLEEAGEDSVVRSEGSLEVVCELVGSPSSSSIKASHSVDM